MALIKVFSGLYKNDTDVSLSFRQFSTSTSNQLIIEELLTLTLQAPFIVWDQLP